METFIPWTLVKRGVRRQVITPIDAPEHFEKEAVVERSARKHAKDSPLIRALGLAHYWQRLLDDGKFQSLTEIAAVEGMDRAQVTRITQLTRLAPGIVNLCFLNQSGRSKMESLTKACQPANWRDQKTLFESHKCAQPLVSDVKANHHDEGARKIGGLACKFSKSAPT